MPPAPCLKKNVLPCADGLSGTAAFQQSVGYSSEFAMTKTTEYDFKFAPGQVWQWTWRVTDTDGITTVTGKDLVLSAGKFDMPCCLPGYFANISDPIGACHAAKDGHVWDLCKRY